MNARVLRRFVILLAALTVVVFVGTDILDDFVNRPPGDYETEVGSQRMEDGLYDEALEHFATALAQAPNHRGALMGRALVYIKMERYDEAIAELDYLIEYLSQNVMEDDVTGRGVLAAAYANRGIVYDRKGEYRKALDDYIQSLKTDEETVSGPGVVHKILYGTEKVSTVRDRARYIYEQLKLPPEQRLMRVPEIDAQQRMYKP